MSNIRIKKIASMCTPCDYIADIGTDHGKTIIELLNNNIAKHYFACDINEKPLNFAKKNINKIIDNDSIVEYILSDGLQNLSKKVFTSYIITGMGYETINHILKNIYEYNFNYLIVSPQTELKKFEQFILDKNLFILQKEIVFEEKKYYFIYKLIKNEHYTKNELLIHNNNVFPKDVKLYKNYILLNINKLEKIIKQIPNDNEKYLNILEELNENREYIKLFE